MSGFEIVGLALALFPVVIEIVDAYGGMITGRDVKHLAESLRNQQQIFLNAVEYLLRSSVSATQLADLLSDPGGVSWNDPELNTTVLDRLGPQAASILGTVSDIHKTVLKLQQKLPPPDNELTLAKRATLVIKSFSRGSYYKASLDRLKIRISEFRTLTKDAVELAPSRSGRAKDLENLDLIQRCASGLYEACRAGWKCDCDQPHPANIKLNVDHSRSDRNQVYLTFSFLFAEHAHQAYHEHWMTAEVVSPRVGSAAPRPFMIRTLSGSTAVSSKLEATQSHTPAPSIAPSGSAAASVVTQDTSSADDLCTILRSCVEPVRPVRRRLGSISDSSGQNYDLFSRSEPITTRQSVVLAEHFRQQSILSNRFRVELALMLAKGVLQISSTSWLDGKWTKDNILLVTDAPNTPLPYVSHRFDSARRGSKSSTLIPVTSNPLAAWIRNPSMFSLGVFLLEVCYNQSIEDLAIGDEKDASAYTPLLTAMRLSKVVQDELGMRYAQAVRACLDFPGVELDPAGKPKDPKRFAQDMMRDIVDPLKTAADTFGL